MHSSNVREKIFTLRGDASEQGFWSHNFGRPVTGHLKADLRVGFLAFPGLLIMDGRPNSM